VISGVAFCPHPPLLVPEVAAGAAGELDGLRAACRSAIISVCAGSQPVLLGAGSLSRAHPPQARGTLAGFGVAGHLVLGARTSEAPPELPLSLTVGAWLVREALGPDSGARGFAVGPDFASSPGAGELRALAGMSEIALIVLADGSARRSIRAPGYYDPRAAGFDAAVAGALREGDPAALGRLDATLGAALLAAGVPAWHAAADLLGGRRYRAHLAYDDAPYGVGYFVASWLPGADGSAGADGSGGDG
jgi:hypothetical protein